DDIAVSGDTVAPPSEPPAPAAPIPAAPDAKSRADIVKDNFNIGLTLAAHGTEDATDFVKERKIQDRYWADEDLSPAQVVEWHERSRTSLQRAADQAARARGEIPSS